MSAFDDLVEQVANLRSSKSIDSSELRHLAEFLSDIVSDVKHDVDRGNYRDTDPATVARTEIIASLQSFITNARWMLSSFGERGDPGPEINVGRLEDGRFRVDIDTGDDPDYPDYTPENRHGPQIKICLNDEPIWNNE